MKGYSPDCPNVDLTVACDDAPALYPYPSTLNNICPPTISFVIFSNAISNDCSSDIIVTIF